MLEGSQKLLLPWSLMSNVKLSWMLVNGHFCQRCHVRWFLTAYWRVRAWVDAKCSFFLQGFCDAASRPYSSISSLQRHKAPLHPSSFFFNKPRSDFTKSAFKWFPHQVFFKVLVSYKKMTMMSSPSEPDTCEDVQGGKWFMCKYLSIKIFDMGSFTIASTCFTESGSKTENG